jgi:hypothetical protein
LFQIVYFWKKNWLLLEEQELDWESVRGCEAAR